MIIQISDGLEINYEKYYAKLFGIKYHDAQFRVNQFGVITKSKSGIPLVPEVIKDLGLDQYVYQFHSYAMLKQDVAQIRKIIPEESSLVFAELESIFPSMVDTVLEVAKRNPTDPENAKLISHIEENGESW